MRVEDGKMVALVAGPAPHECGEFGQVGERHTGLAQFDRVFEPLHIDGREAPAAARRRGAPSSPKPAWLASETSASSLWI